MPLYEYQCERGHVTEAIKPRGAATLTCSCGLAAMRRSFYATAMHMGKDADWSSVVRDNGFPRPPVSERRVPMREFTEATEQLEYEHQRIEEMVGRTVPPPSLYKMAKAKAQQAMKAGVTDSLDLK